jgi:hypothetical protein
VYRTGGTGGTATGTLNPNRGELAHGTPTAIATPPPTAIVTGGTTGDLTVEIVDEADEKVRGNGYYWNATAGSFTEETFMSGLVRGKVKFELIADLERYWETVKAGEQYKRGQQLLFTPDNLREWKIRDLVRGSERVLSSAEIERIIDGKTV